MGSSRLEGCVSCRRPSLSLEATEAQMAPPPATGAVGRRGPHSLRRAPPPGGPCRHQTGRAPVFLFPPPTSLFKKPAHILTCFYLLKVNIRWICEGSGHSYSPCPCMSEHSHTKTLNEYYLTTMYGKPSAIKSNSKLSMETLKSSKSKSC